MNPFGVSAAVLVVMATCIFPLASGETARLAADPAGESQAAYVDLLALDLTWNTTEITVSLTLAAAPDDSHRTPWTRYGVLLILQGPPPTTDEPSVLVNIELSAWNYGDDDWPATAQAHVDRETPVDLPVQTIVSRETVAWTLSRDRLLESFPALGSTSPWLASGSVATAQAHAEPFVEAAAETAARIVLPLRDRAPDQGDGESVLIGSVESNSSLDPAASATTAPPSNIDETDGDERSTPFGSLWLLLASIAAAAATRRTRSGIG